ncbi:jacalin-like lectin [Limnobacter sp.]|uniref:jacalin-like lectin n=1 Tax=Limnobacter sp. TaxID=2003368 RepID=UPI0027338069|nr:lectin [Limnobacter sp.]MDP3188966.1 lectin [Limnobacter sp.]
MIPNRNHRLKASFLFAGMLALCAPVHAKDAPEISPTLKKMLGALPLDNAKEQLQGMVGALKKTSCGGGLKGCYFTEQGDVQLYFFTSNTAQQTFLVVVNRKFALPKLLKENVQKVMGTTSVSSPIISISTSDFALDTVKMPPSLQQVVREKYFNVNSLSFSSGVQLAARADLGGPIKLAMESFGVKGTDITLRAAVVMPIPTDLAGGAGTGAGMADAVSHGDTMKKAGADAAMPEAFVELQFAPNSRLSLKAPEMDLTDATFFLNNSLTFGYKGNAIYRAVPNKKIITHFQTPMNPAGALDLLDFTFRMATPPAFTLEDHARVMFAMATPDPRLAPYGGGFIRNIESYKNILLTVTKPLSVFQVRNPNPPPEYRFGDSNKPFPTDPKYFNIALLGPLADGGPWMHLAGDGYVLGQKMGWLDASTGLDGLKGDAGEMIDLKLGPLGRVKIKMQALANVGPKTQELSMRGNFVGQAVNVTMSGSTLSIEVPPSCVNPFEIKTSVAIEATTNIASVFEGQGGANVDPSKIQGCIGAQLEAAYKKIAGEYKNLSGYTAAAANAELKKIANAAAAAEAEAKKQAEAAANEAKKQAEAAQREYNKTKDAARNVANSSTNAANKAFNDAGNAFKKLGKKKKRKPAPDIRFAASVFDWDFYYDNAPDVVKAKVDLSTHWRDNGFQEGRQGSPEFGASFYWHRYTDVQSLCKLGDRLCVTNHWLNYGIEQGRQGSAGFSLHGYMDRYTDLQNAFGQENYEAAIDHWFDNGEDEGRSTQATIAGSGPVSGPARVGGGGGGAWSDMATCKNQQVTGFRIGAGRLVDRVQFKYPSGWAPRQGGGNGWNVDVTLPNGQYIVRVDYRNGSMVDQVSFTTNTGVKYGPYGGGGGSPGVYTVTPGEKLGCMRGRAGSSMDRLTFTSTGPR